VKRIVPAALIGISLIFYGVTSSTSAQGVTSKAVTQAQITNLQNQITSLTEALNQSRYQLTDVKNKLYSATNKLDEVTTTLDGVTLSRHVWLTPSGLTTGCGAGAINVSTFYIPGSTSGFTGCVADILVKPITTP
jgi:hypothetical protein